MKYSATSPTAGDSSASYHDVRIRLAGWFSSGSSPIALEDLQDPEYVRHGFLPELSREARSRLAALFSSAATEPEQQRAVLQQTVSVEPRLGGAS